ncbi:MAG: AmmeMemoRadiSam system protein A [Lachnospiraceae bacterium]|nr:AmmeMemoRadiSam system protein A [Lachnospiraceae bacterium]
MAILGAYVVPHPPVILPEVGKGRESEIRNTSLAYQKVAEEIKALAPDTVVVISSHMEMYSDYFHIAPGDTVKGSMKEFGTGEVSISIEYDTELRDALCTLCAECSVPAGTLGAQLKELDHGSLIPLYFLDKAYGEDMPKIIRIGVSGLMLHEHYRVGMLIRQAAEKADRKVVVLASGDLSHRLSEDGPYGYAEEGPIYDAKVMEALAKPDFEELFAFDEEELDKAGECGHRCFVMLSGIFDCIGAKADKLSYEGPFGVGYGIVRFEPLGEQRKAAERSFFDIYSERMSEEMANIRRNEDAYVSVARLALENFVKTNSITKLPKDAPDELREKRAGAFVCIKKQGKLRGCIGTIEPVMGNVGEEIIMNAMSVAVRDKRFAPVRVDELDYLTYSVDVMCEPEPVESIDELDVKRYGVIVTSEGKRGVLLPNLEGIDTVEEQLFHARQKAGIKDNEQILISKFEVERHA